MVESDMLGPRQSFGGSIMTAQIVSMHEAKLEAYFLKQKPGFLLGKDKRRCKIDSKGWFSYYNSKDECKGFFLLGPETSVKIDPDIPYKWYLSSRTDY